ncbi:transposase, partial [Quadrisphaera sp. GCM10027208]|uniref:transposase n=1 Tax=Quadrisphaera sp. GCM10027208 TaxID=3273423 RepID=UPI00360BA5EF
AASELPSSEDLDPYPANDAPSPPTPSTAKSPIAEVVRDLGINAGTLGNWVAKYREQHPVSEELSVPERARLRELEREARELRLEVAFLKKAAAYFAREEQ